VRHSEDGKTSEPLREPIRRVHAGQVGKQADRPVADHRRPIGQCHGALREALPGPRRGTRGIPQAIAKGAAVKADHPQPVNPALMRHLRERSKRRENRVADQITTFAGSMKFVYIHAVWFTLWIALGVEDYPFGLLTMIVSLEAIFLSTFVMISQNRADEKRQVIADEAWRTVQEEEQQNERLLRVSDQILELTKQIHEANVSATPASRPPAQ
jgi:hypothetical protein